MKRKQAMVKTVKKAVAVMLGVNLIFGSCEWLPHFDLSMTAKAEGNEITSEPINTLAAVKEFFNGKGVSYQANHKEPKSKVDDETLHINESAYESIASIYFGGNLWKVAGVDEQRNEAVMYPVYDYGKIPFNSQASVVEGFSEKIWHNNYLAYEQKDDTVITYNNTNITSLPESNIRKYLTGNNDNSRESTFHDDYFATREVEWNAVNPFNYSYKLFNYRSIACLNDDKDKFYLPSGSLRDEYIDLGYEDVVNNDDNRNDKAAYEFPIPARKAVDLCDNIAWLRSALYYCSSHALAAGCGYSVHGRSVYDIRALAPACRLHLPSVIFSSEIAQKATNEKFFNPSYKWIINNTRRAMLTLLDNSESNVEGQIIVSKTVAGKLIAVFLSDSNLGEGEKIGLLCELENTSSTNETDKYQFVFADKSGLFNLPEGTSKINAFICTESDQNSGRLADFGAENDPEKINIEKTRYRVRYAKPCTITNITQPMNAEVTDYSESKEKSFGETSVGHGSNSKSKDGTLYFRLTPGQLDQPTSLYI